MAKFGKVWARSKRRGELRSQVLARDPLCRVCGEKASAEADHIVPLARGGLDNIDNMRGICKACHRAKTKRDWEVAKIVDVNGDEVPEVMARVRGMMGRKRRRGRRHMTWGIREKGNA